MRARLVRSSSIATTRKRERCNRYYSLKRLTSDIQILLANMSDNHERKTYEEKERVETTVVEPTRKSVWARRCTVRCVVLRRGWRACERRHPSSRLILPYRTIEESLDYSYIKPLLSLVDETRLIGTLVPIVHHVSRCHGKLTCKCQIHPSSL